MGESRPALPPGRTETVGEGSTVTVDHRRAVTVPTPVTPTLTIRRYIDHALICSACCR